MRVLHITDTHLGLRLKSWCHPRGWQRMADCQAMLERALEPALNQEVDLVIHSGDLFDRSSPPPEAIEGANTVLARVARRTPTVIMPGNHDRHGLGIHIDPAPGLHIVDEAKQLRFGDLAVGFVPYVREAGIWAHDAASVADGADVLVAHQSFHGARVPGFTFRHGRHRETVGAHQMPRGIRHVLCGHIHPRQITQIGGAQVVQPGSTERTSFSEERQTKGYAMWEFGRTTEFRFVDLPTRPLVRLRSESDLARVRAGTLVLMDKLAPVDLVDEVAARGGWFASKRPRRLPKRPEPQLALF